MRKITINSIDYWYNKKANVLYFDKGGTKPVPLAYFDVYEYQSFLEQIKYKP